MIRSFACKRTESLFAGKSVRGFRAFEASAQRKLLMLDVAAVLLDLASPPGNRLEAFAGDRKGQHSIRINDPFRV